MVVAYDKKQNYAGATNVLPLDGTVLWIEDEERFRRLIAKTDNGPEFVAKAVTSWLHDLEVDTLFIEPGSPWENGYVESFNPNPKLFFRGRT